MKEYGCDCGWTGSTLPGLMEHIAYAHDIVVKIPAWVLALTRKP